MKMITTVPEMVDAMKEWENSFGESFFDYFCNRCSKTFVTGYFDFVKNIDPEFKSKLEEIELDDELYSLVQINEVTYDDELKGDDPEKLDKAMVYLAHFILLTPQRVEGFNNFINDKNP